MSIEAFFHAEKLASPGWGAAQPGRDVLNFGVRGNA